MDDEWATRLRLWIEAIDNDDAGAIWPRDVEAALDEIERLQSENARLLNDRARFPDQPDGIGRMIEAHLANLRALRVEADKRVSRLRDENERLRADLHEARESDAESIAMYQRARGRLDEARASLRAVVRAFDSAVTSPAVATRARVRFAMGEAVSVARRVLGEEER